METVAPGAGGQGSPGRAPASASLQIGPADRIRIAKIGVDAALSLQKVTSDGHMPDPPPDQVGIYDFSGVAASAGGGSAYGGTPGSGNTVVAGRHSSPGGPLPFYRLTSLAGGDMVELSIGGATYAYRVVILCSASAGDFTNVVRRTSQEVLTLLTDGTQGGGNRHYAVAERQGRSLEPKCPAGNPL
jgi:hypothetical protein